MATTKPRKVAAINSVTSKWLKVAIVAGITISVYVLYSSFTGSQGDVLRHILDRGSHAAVLRNKKGMEVHILPTGAVLQKILVHDKSGKLRDVVLGFDDEATYQNGNVGYFGAVIGRVANRIAGAKFVLGGRTYHLTANEGNNTLHGGVSGWNKKVWEIDGPHVNSDLTSVHLTHISPDGDEGFPGTVTASVTYSLSDKGELTAEFQATSDSPTPINMAQHCYFNLDGPSSTGTILDHYLKINGSYYTPVNGELIPTGQVAPVAGTPYDFNSAHQIGERIANVVAPAPGGYDMNYVLWGYDEEAAVQNTKKCVVSEMPHHAVTAWSVDSGIYMDVKTNAPGLQFYSGNYLDGSIRGKGDAKYPKHGGFALETQMFPNFVNQPSFPQCILEPGQLYRHQIVWHFYTLD